MSSGRRSSAVRPRDPARGGPQRDELAPQVRHLHVVIELADERRPRLSAVHQRADLELRARIVGEAPADQRLELDDVPGKRQEAHAVEPIAERRERREGGDHVAAQVQMHVVDEQVVAGRTARGRRDRLLQIHQRDAAVRRPRCEPAHERIEIAVGPEAEAVEVAGPRPLERGLLAVAHRGRALPEREDEIGIAIVDRGGEPVGGECRTAVPGALRRPAVLEVTRPAGEVVGREPSSMHRGERRTRAQVDRHGGQENARAGLPCRAEHRAQIGLEVAVHLLQAAIVLT